MVDRKPLTSHRQAELAKPELLPYNLDAGGSLFLKVMPNGTKKWQFRYFYLQKAKTLSMGLFPAVGLAEAKEKRDDAKKLLAKEINPSEKRKKDKGAVLQEQANSFQVIATEWLARQTDKAQSTNTQSVWLLSFPIADFGHCAIRDITPKMVLDTCRRFESQGKLETAKC
jgi:hypothetical protein